MYTGNGTLFAYRKALYQFFHAYKDKINWEESGVRMDYCSFNPREVYSLAVRIDEQTVGYCYIMITGRHANVPRPITTNIRMFISMDGMDFRNDYLTVVDATHENIYSQITRFILNN